MPHHSSTYDPEMMEAFARFQERLGKTGKFPDGKLTKQDEGELAFAVLTHKGKVCVEFGQPVHWFAMTPKQAIELGELLIKKGAEAWEGA